MGSPPSRLARAAAPRRSAVSPGEEKRHVGGKSGKEQVQMWAEGFTEGRESVNYGGGCYEQRLVTRALFSKFG